MFKTRIDDEESDDQIEEEATDKTGADKKYCEEDSIDNEDVQEMVPENKTDENLEAKATTNKADGGEERINMSCDSNESGDQLQADDGNEIADQIKAGDQVEIAEQIETASQITTVNQIKTDNQVEANDQTETANQIETVHQLETDDQVEADDQLEADARSADSDDYDGETSDEKESHTETGNYDFDINKTSSGSLLNMMSKLRYILENKEPAYCMVATRTYYGNEAGSEEKIDASYQGKADDKDEKNVKSRTAEVNKVQPTGRNGGRGKRLVIEEIDGIADRSDSEMNTWKVMDKNESSDTHWQIIEEDNRVPCGVEAMPTAENGSCNASGSKVDDDSSNGDQIRMPIEERVEKSGSRVEVVMAVQEHANAVGDLIEMEAEDNDASTGDQTEMAAEGNFAAGIDQVEVLVEKTDVSSGDHVEVAAKENGSATGDEDDMAEKGNEDPVIDVAISDQMATAARKNDCVASDMVEMAAKKSELVNGTQVGVLAKDNDGASDHQIDMVTGEDQAKEEHKITERGKESVEDGDNEVNGEKVEGSNGATAGDDYDREIEDICGDMSAFQEDWDEEINEGLSKGCDDATGNAYDKKFRAKSSICLAAMTLKDWDLEVQPKGRENSNGNHTNVEPIYKCYESLCQTGTASEDRDKEIKLEKAGESNKKYTDREAKDSSSDTLNQAEITANFEDGGKIDMARVQVATVRVDGNEDQPHLTKAQKRRMRKKRNEQKLKDLHENESKAQMEKEKEDWDNKIAVEKAKESQREYKDREAEGSNGDASHQAVLTTNEKDGGKDNKTESIEGASTAQEASVRANDDEDKPALTKTQKRRMRRKRTEQKWKSFGEDVKEEGESKAKRVASDDREDDVAELEGDSMLQEGETTTANVERAVEVQTGVSIMSNGKVTTFQMDNAQPSEASVSQRLVAATLEEEGAAVSKERNPTSVHEEEGTTDDKPALTKRQKRRLRKKQTDQRRKTFYETEQQAQIEKASIEAIEKNVHGFLEEVKESMEKQNAKKVSFEDIKTKVSYSSKVAS